MIESQTRKAELKSRLSTMVNAKELASFSSPGRFSSPERRRNFGQGMLVLSVFTLVAGLYLTDWGWRMVFLFGALLYAGVGVFSIDRANRVTPKAMDSK